MAQTPKYTIEKVVDCPRLPTLPQVAIEVLELTANPNVGMADLSKVVQKDPALSARVLKTINSSFYGLSSPCGSIDRAMAYLGMNTVKALVLGFSLIESFKGVGETFDLSTVWRRALFSATSAKIIGDQLPEIDSDEAFTVGLFQDIGAIAMLVQMKSAYAAVVADIPHDEHARAERDHFGFTHAQVGSVLAERWKFPESIAQCVRWHHDPERVSTHYVQEARLANLSMMCAEALREDAQPEDMREVLVRARRWFGAGMPESGAFEAIAAQAPVLAKFFGQKIENIPDTRDLMERAQEQSIEHQLHMEREKSQIQEEATRDGLTGAFNRKKFDSELHRWFESWQDTGTPLAVLFYDADRFKSVNDTHGHAAGDAVLVDLARVTRDVIRDKGDVFRYGGEEFAVILPNIGRHDAEALAERLREAIEQHSVDVSGLDCGTDTLGVTVSIGVSATDCAEKDRVDSAERLLQEADRAVYVAKESGRNAVRVWGHLRNADDIEDAVETINEGEQTPRAGVPEDLVVWLVEDDALAAVLLRTMLQNRRGVTVEWFRTLEGVSKASQEVLKGTRPRPGVVLTDHALDGGTGFDLVSIVQTSGSMSDVPVVVCTATADADTRDRYLNGGASAFVTKEQIAREMNRWVSRIIELGTQPRAAAA
ncbi:MAG: HDOD domain-containing protein [Phycisphaerales bacterium]